jgi:ADP-heptose:LPS heptosyltransferase
MNYVHFARLWLQHFPGSRFIVLGTSFIADKAAFLKTQIGDRLINLVGRTSTSDAFAVLQHATLIMSDDSGLMHMAWVSGIPTIGLFGSTRSDWSRPLGPHSYLFGSADLACGNCMNSVCRLGDTRCLTRVSPEMVLQEALRLVSHREI